MIKIVSGYTDKGGSTVALINLCNFFNENGLECTLYGNQNWHRDKCKSGNIENDLTLKPNDKLIYHFYNLEKRPDVDVVLLSCHEKWWFPVGKIKQYWDEAVFLHNEHRKYHSEYNGKFSIIPNLKENLHQTDKNNLNKIAGVIGSIEHRKQTHMSIIRALKDGCEKIYLFGHIGEQPYYDKFVKPLLNEKIIEYGHTTNKQEMYDMVGRVYHSSLGEVACLVKDECFLTGTEFFGNKETENEVSTLSNIEILNLWKKSLKL
jgi:hypothetical protein